MSNGTIPDLLEHQLRTLVIALNTECINGCNCCPFGDPMDGLRTIHYIRLIENAAKAGLEAIIFTGGNLSHRSDAVDLVRFAALQGLKVAVECCGEGVTPIVAQRLKDAGIGRMDIYLDVETGVAHPAREPMLRDRSIRSIRMFRDYGIPTRAHLLLHRRLKKPLEVAIREFLDLGVDRVVLHRTAPIPNAVWYERCRLRDQDLVELRGRYEALTPRIARRVLLGCGLSFLHLAEEPGKRGHDGRCHVARDRLFVDVDGAVYPCQHLSTTELFLGDIENDDVHKIWLTHPKLKEVRDRQAFLGPCWKCEISGTCRGCRAAAYMDTGELMASDPDCPYARGTRLQRWKIESGSKLRKLLGQQKARAPSRKGRPPKTR